MSNTHTGPYKFKYRIYKGDYSAYFCNGNIELSSHLYEGRAGFADLAIQWDFEADSLVPSIGADTAHMHSHAQASYNPAKVREPAIMEPVEHGVLTT